MSALLLFAAAASAAATSGAQDVVGSFLGGLASAPPVSLRLCPLRVLPAHNPTVCNVTAGTWTYNWGDGYNYTIVARAAPNPRPALCGAHSQCHRSIPAHSIAAVRERKSSLWATAGGKGAHFRLPQTMILAGACRPRASAPAALSAAACANASSPTTCRCAPRRRAAGSGA